MAWAQSQKEIDELKKLAQQRREEAEARKQLNDAENRIDVATDQNNVRADRQQLQRQAEHERSLAARQRFADSHALTAVSDPGRYSPQAYKAAKDYLENRGIGRTRYEFDEAQRTARQAATEKARGMIWQGREAAEARAAGDRDVAEIGAASALKKSKLETAAQKELGVLDSATKRYAVDAEHGTRNADGTVTPGSRERVEQIKGDAAYDAAVDAQREAAKGIAAKAEAERLQKREELVAKAKLQLAKNDLDASNAELKSMTDLIGKQYDNLVTPEDRAKVTAQLREQYKNSPLAMMLIGIVEDEDKPAQQTPQTQQTPPATPTNGAAKPQGGNVPQEGDVKTFKQGTFVFRNGKWVPQK